MKSSPCVQQHSIAHIYQNSRDLYMKLAVIFMLQAATATRFAQAKYTPSPTEDAAPKPTFKVFVDPKGVAHLDTPVGPTNLAGAFHGAATNSPIRVAFYIDAHQGVTGGQLLGPMILARQILPSATQSLCTYEE